MRATGEPGSDRLRAGRPDGMLLPRHKQAGADRPIHRVIRAAALAALPYLQPTSAPAQPSLPGSIAVPDASIVMTVHAAGAQVYECVADGGGRPAWRFREPIATLLADGRTVGHHFAGPSWQLADGSLATAKVAASAPGATGEDIPWLKLAVAAGQASGRLATVTAIQRINTRGGTLTGPCDSIGALRPVPYTSDYVFLAKGG